MGNQMTWANNCLWSLNSSINFLLLYSHFNCSSTIIFLNWEVTQLKVSQRTFSQCTQVHGKDESCVIPRYLMKDGREPKAPKFKKQDQQPPSLFRLTIEIRTNALDFYKHVSSLKALYELYPTQHSPSPCLFYVYMGWKQYIMQTRIMTKFFMHPLDYPQEICG